MIKVDFNDEAKKCDISFTGDTNHVCHEMTMALATWRRVMVQKLGEEETGHRYVDIILGYMNGDVRAEVNAIVEGMEHTVTEK